MAVYELAALGRHRWWWRLHRALPRHFRGIRPGRLERTHPERDSLAYGETPAISVRRLLQVSGLAPGARFIDLGSGRGLAALSAASLGYPSEGLELFPEYVERSNRVAAELKLPARFTQGDLVRDPWPEGELYYLASTAFGHQTRQLLLERFNGLPPGALVATLDWSLPLEGRVAFYLPVTWGLALCQLYATES